MRINRAVAKYPQRSDYHRSGGRPFLNQGKIDVALVDLNRAVDLQEDNWVSVYENSGNTYAVELPRKSGQ